MPNVKHRRYLIYFFKGPIIVREDLVIIDKNALKKEQCVSLQRLNNVMR
jgi:hypothetical protein